MDRNIDICYVTIRKGKCSWIPVLDSECYNTNQYRKLKTLTHFEDKLFPWEPTAEGLLPLRGEIRRHHLKFGGFKHIGVGGPFSKVSLRNVRTTGREESLVSYLLFVLWSLCLAAAKICKPFF